MGGEQDISNMGGLRKKLPITYITFLIGVLAISGFPFTSGGLFGQTWASNEGQADHFATHICPNLLWSNERSVTRNARAVVPASAKTKCDEAWSTQDDQDLCYRAVIGAKTISDILAALGGGGSVSFDKTDRNQVRTTNNAHPAAQCRLDTYVAGATCPAEWDLSVIPGKNGSRGDNTARGEEASARYNCTEAGQYTTGLRPRC